MVDWVVDAVAGAGATAIKAVVSSHHAEVAAHLDSRAQVIYQREPLGTGDAVKQVPAEQFQQGDVLVVNGDSPLLTADSIRAVVEEHRRTGAQATIATVDDPRRDDGRVIRNPDGTFRQIVERNDVTEEQRASHEFNVGVYCFQGTPLADALGKLTNENRSGEFYLPDVLSNLKPITIVKIADPDEALGINDRATLAIAVAAMRERILRRHMLAGVTITDPASTFIDASVQIGEDTVIEPFTFIKGQSVIGEGCRIGPLSTLIDPENPPVTLRPDDDLDKVATEIVESRRSSLLVVDDKGRPLGRILSDDMLDALVPGHGRLHFPRILQ